MSNTIVNAAPMAISLGAQDLSTRVVTPQPPSFPQHMPKFYIFAKKGNTKPYPVTASEMLLKYGTDTFNSDQRYYNHVTRFLSAVVGQGNTCVVQRVVPADAGIKANAIVYIDIIPATIPLYERNSDGSYVLNATTHDPVPTGATTAGYKTKLIVEYTTDETAFGAAPIKPGTMNDGTTQSTMYPIFEYQAQAQGFDYNNVGLAFESVSSDELSQEIVEATKALPYKLSIVNRKDANSSPVIFKSLAGEQSVLMSLKDLAINPLTQARFDIGTVFNKSWYNETNPLLPLKYTDFDGFKLYSNHLATVSTLLMTNEAPLITATETTWADTLDASTLSWYDFTTDDNAKLINDELLLMNIFTGLSSRGVHYQTVVQSDLTPTLSVTQKEAVWGANNPIYMTGGTDGTINNANYEEAFIVELAKYNDPDSEVMDTALNPESIMYDSGLTLPTKKEMINFIRVRKDTAIVLSTHSSCEVGCNQNLSDHIAVGAALMTSLELAPESEYYGISAARAVIIGGASELPNTATTSDIAATYEVAVKAAKMMGASNRKWKFNERFDRAPGNILTETINYTPRFIPNGIKPSIWSQGIVFAQPYDLKQYHFPAIQTVYKNDTSVLNSFPTMMAVCTLNKIAIDSWRNFTGVTDLTQAELAEEVVDYVNKSTKDIFAGMFVIVPEVLFTEQDEQRGYSWQLITKIYANNMKTVMVHTTQVFRLSDLNQ